MIIKIIPSFGFAIPGKCLMSFLGLLLLSFPVSAAVLTVSFEESEGFSPTLTGPPSVTAGTPAADWSFSGGTEKGRIYVSSAQALDGTLSLAMAGGTQISSIRPVSQTENYSEATWSFINPTATFAANANVGFAWVYFYDETVAANRALKIYSRYGSNSSTRLLLINDGVATTTYTVTSSYNNWNQWNTLSLNFNAEAKTYSLEINGNSLSELTNLALPNNWDVDSISQIALLSPASGTTYYDKITFQAVPEPTAAWLIPLGVGVMAFQKRKRWLNLGGAKAA